MNLEEKMAILKVNGFELSEFKEFQDDKDLVLASIQYDARNLQYASEELKKDEDILATAIANLDSEYWRTSKDGWSREDSYDVDRFLDDMEIDVDVLKGKNKVADVLIESGYFDYDMGLNKPRLGYKDIFGESFTPKVSKYGTYLEGIEEFESLKDKYLDLDYELDNEIDYDEDYVEYCQTRAEQAKIRHRLAYLEARCVEWSKNASVLERISVDAITADGTSIRDMRIGPVGAYLEDILKDTEIMSDDDLRRKFELFQEKCTVAHNYMHIECDWEKEQDGKLVCTRIDGASEILNRNCKIASTDFKSGHIKNYADSIRDDWVIDEEYEDSSIILVTSELSDKEEQLSKLEAEAKTIDEAEILIEHQKEGQDIGE